MNEIAEAITDSPEGTTLVLNKTRNKGITEGLIFFFVSALNPIVALLEGEGDLTARGITAASLAGIVSGLVAVKAYFSHSHYE